MEREEGAVHPPVKLPDERFKNGVLSGVDLTKTLTREEYKERLDKLQKKLEVLHGELYRLRIPVVIGFEGWDAAEKAVRSGRLTSHLDPRGYKVNPTAAPNDVEEGTPLSVAFLAGDAESGAYCDLRPAPGTGA